MTLPALGTRPAPRRRTARASRGRRLAGLLFLLPLFTVNILVIAGPAVMSVFYSFTDWDGLNAPGFVGLDNYVRLAGDDSFRTALRNNLLWTVFFLTVPMGMGLLGAYLLTRIRRGQLLFRLLFFVPYVVATVVSASIWRQLLNPSVGIGGVLGDFGVPWAADINALGDGDLALGAIALINNWQWWGFLMLLFLAAMRSVDPSLYEAARLDGAGRWREFWHITLPGIRPTFVFLFLMTIIWSFLVFDYVYILTQGGPGGATEVLSTLLYRSAFTEQQAGYGSAIGVVLALISATAVTGYLVLRRRAGWDV
ncbi:carbohydrate ABC transporter membrane protein 1 (CUT1 family) [Murinocardiopsis flavida]|uniref:Carbohydrate ABC transporter membrane protein 1 (CUT1 family) n=1 Tax=Murinocardiopsis flavida TaxID=645275 RepID=A0A2P8D569_9ACTN|nr:sugar ABC transporter permease [Murinocardiopsis flavida]PSK92367.1 carbohydrate ABC transporter membrane protein 1 (CUT1 family) [Murinocardiopsis flavida]